MDYHSQWIAFALLTSEITDLNLEGNPNLGDAGVSHLVDAIRQRQHLECLRLDNTGLGHAGDNSLISLLQHSNNKLTSVRCGDSPRISDAQKTRIQALCDANQNLKKALDLLDQGKKDESHIPWKRVFELKDEKPELVYEILRKEPANMGGIMGALVNSILMKHLLFCK